MFRKIALTAAAFAVIAGAGLTANTQKAEAKVRVHIGLGFPGYYGGYYVPVYRPVYRGGCYRTRGHRVRYWHRGHGHWHVRWRRGRLICY